MTTTTTTTTRVASSSSTRNNRILKDANGDIGEHLRNHIHLTNCIHLKNNMHKQSPVLTDRALMRDLIVLQRSRSLRDPSASPPAWNTPPSVVDLLPKKGDLVEGGRRSVDLKKSSRRLSALSGSSPVVNFGTSKVTPSDERSGPVSGERDSGRRVKREESSRKSYRIGDDYQNVNEVVSHGSGSKASRRLSRVNDAMVKTLSDQLNEVVVGDSDDVVSSNVRPRVRYGGGGGGGNTRGCAGGMSRPKRRKFRGTRRVRGKSRDTGGGKSEMSVASNTLPQVEKHDGEKEGFGEQNMTKACGIPFNWSRIHHRGKTFLDKAGRSLSCGMSDSKGGRKGETNERNGSDKMMIQSDDDSSSFIGSDGEALPLLVDSGENDGWVHDYSGELGIFADSLLKNDEDSDLASEGRSGEKKHKKKSHVNARHRHRQQHQSLTEKYTPKTFRDLLGQNLVVQALSNAVARRKLGLLYVFHGPNGTGKTSCARIFARALNCHSMEQPKPCGTCSSCVSHDMGKSWNIREVGPVGNYDFEKIMDLLDGNVMVSSQSPRVFIFDDCDTLSSDCWNALSKVVDRAAPRHVVFILVCSSLDVLPHVIISRCQKFFFPKLKDADIVYSLQWIASKEEIEIDKDALKLIASRSDGSLRDAEMTLEQLSLLGQRISVPLVQELVGLVSDEKLVDLLDLALSADTVNTVKNLRTIMETSVEPLALMSQLATVITDILAGSYDFTKDQHKRKFFRRQPLPKEDMEKLRQALKTLSEAEKQLRVSNDKLTWLTAALLQLAPDQNYLLQRSSTADTGGRESSDHHLDPSSDAAGGRSSGLDRRRGDSRKNRPAVEEIWLEVIEKLRVNGLREFLYKEGRIVSLNLGSAPTVHLMFSSPLTKSTAEKFRSHIMQAFEAVLESPVTIEIRCETKKDPRNNVHHHHHHPTVKDKSLPQSLALIGHDYNIDGSGRSEIVEVTESNGQRRQQQKQQEEERTEPVGSSALARARRKHLEASQSQNQSQSIVRGKVSLAHVIQQADGCSLQNGWSKRKAVSIAEKLEQENLRLEPRSRSLLCWKSSRGTRRKATRLKVRTRRARPHTLLKLVSCGKCLSTRSPTR
ncbi:AAA-type ATPase family protein [Arabidopsis thaliana]|uniref:Protein STICHEL-like 3 n=1 Tax=Arabidopsis thaliana TaxID=3702 RepID=STIL3_ARATH|nr:AAA-type ATPase family protein [Arabidopsis thaliana]F4JRP0.1 RecName: Full=Protein STICHEL-like 3 [Arabidopsis thaliana]AEE84094.1 AAA-type ATPase family protein [Arabidopsis thaliana]|eukprot:NP_193617.3 AAA-type ATPase family protein [Arabidopsis thaliana]